MMTQLCYAYTQMAQQLAAHLIHCARNGESECITVRRAVALDNNATQPQQARAIVLAVIHPPFECLNDRQGDESREFREKISPEFFTQVSGKHLCYPFRRFQGNIADETITHN